MIHRVVVEFDDEIEMGSVINECGCAVCDVIQRDVARFLEVDSAGQVEE